MRKIYIVLLFLVLSLVGCKNKKYSGKIFDVRVEFWNGKSAHVEIWKNANRVSYDAEENIYDFYVDGKLVVLDNLPVVLTEVGSIPSINAENKLYAGKKFTIDIYDDSREVKTWENIEIKSVDPGHIQFVSDQKLLDILPATNTMIIIKEME